MPGVNHSGDSIRAETKRILETMCLTCSRRDQWMVPVAMPLDRLDGLRCWQAGCIGVLSLLRPAAFQPPRV